MRRALCGAMPFLLALALTASLTGCGGKTKEVDVTALAAELAEQVAFQSDGMRKLTAEELTDFLDVPKDARSAFYMGDGGTAEEIIAVQCASEKDAAAVKVAMEKLLKHQIDLVGAYHPEVVPRLENAVLIQKGACAVLCVTDDADTAEQIIRRYLG